MSISCTPEQLNIAKARAISLLQSSLFELATSVGCDIRNISDELLEKHNNFDDHLIYQGIAAQVVSLDKLGG